MRHTRAIVRLRAQRYVRRVRAKSHSAARGLIPQQLQPVAHRRALGQTRERRRSKQAVKTERRAAHILKNSVRLARARDREILIYL